MHRTFVSRLRTSYKASWTPETIELDLGELLDSCWAFRDYLVPAMHPVKAEVERALRTAHGLHFCYHQKTLSYDETVRVITQTVKPLLRRIREMLLGYDGPPLAPYFPPAVDREDVVALEDKQEKQVRKKEMKKMTIVKDIGELQRITTRNLKAGIASMKGRNFVLVDDIGIIPPLYDYETKITGLDILNVNSGEFGYVALYGEQVLMVDEEFQNEKRAAKVDKGGADALKKVRATQRDRAKRIAALEEDREQLNERIESAENLKNPTVKAKRLAEYKAAIEKINATINDLNEDIEYRHQTMGELRRTVKQTAIEEFDEAQFTTIDDLLQDIAKRSGQKLVLMSDKSRRLPKEFGGRRVNLYWVGRETHLRRLASKLPAAKSRGKFENWDLVGRD